jgi:hypothetical protein
MHRTHTSIRYTPSLLAATLVRLMTFPFHSVHLDAGTHQHAGASVTDGDGGVGGGGAAAAVADGNAIDVLEGGVALLQADAGAFAREDSGFSDGGATSVFDLPEDVWELLGLHLTPADLANIAAASHAGREVAHSVCVVGRVARAMFAPGFDDELLFFGPALWAPVISTAAAVHAWPHLVFRLAGAVLDAHGCSLADDDRSGSGGWSGSGSGSSSDGGGDDDSSLGSHGSGSSAAGSGSNYTPRWAAGHANVVVARSHHEVPTNVADVSLLRGMHALDLSGCINLEGTVLVFRWNYWCSRGCYVDSHLARASSC